ncbi:MAG: hypothetical protein IKB80_05165 [Oscillospiraceae bacterium]|nr:hypothetical protein [Oscillospiraceae bacterium]
MLITTLKNKAGLKKWIIDDSARDFFARQAADPKEYFVYFEGLMRGIAEKDPLKFGKTFQKTRQRKRERGE